MTSLSFLPFDLHMFEGAMCIFFILAQKLNIKNGDICCKYHPLDQHVVLGRASHTCVVELQLFRVIFGLLFAYLTNAHLYSATNFGGWPPVCTVEWWLCNIFFPFFLE